MSNFDTEKNSPHIFDSASAPKKNSRHNIKIESVTAKGFGVGYINGFTVFVDGGLPGDELEIHIVKAKSRYGYGKIVEIVRPSAARIESPCPVSGHCGGCQWQHADYQAQLSYKKQIVIDALERVGGIKKPPVQDVVGMTQIPAPAYYRNKAVFPIVPYPNADGFAIGMFAARSHRIVEVDHCIIQHPAHVPILKAVKRHMRSHKIRPYNEQTHTGLMRFVMIRTSLATNEVMVVLTINGTKLPLEKKLAEDLTAVGTTTVVVSRHTAKSNVVLGDSFRIISGNGFIRETIGHVTYQISAPSFFQVNPVQTKILYDIAIAQAQPNGKTILDAHVGAGGVALYAAMHAKKVIGVDIVPEAIADGEKNADINDITNMHFICGAAEDVIPPMLYYAQEGSSPSHATGGCCERETLIRKKLPARSICHEENIQLVTENHQLKYPHEDFQIKPDIVFLDPPRKGCEPALLDALIAAPISKIVYISCDPATFARDVKILVQGGFDLITVQPVDMFPHTGKVEISALLCRGS